MSFIHHLAQQCMIISFSNAHLSYFFKRQYLSWNKMFILWFNFHCKIVANTEPTKLCICFINHLTHCGHVMPYGGRDLGQHWFRCNGLVLDGTKPLPEPMLPYHHYNSLMFIWGQCRLRYHSHQSLKISLKIIFLRFYWNLPGASELTYRSHDLNQILIEIHTFSFKKMHVKMSSAKWRPFCPGLIVLRRRLKQTCPGTTTRLQMSYVKFSYIMKCDAIYNIYKM